MAYDVYAKLRKIDAIAEPKSPSVVYTNMNKSVVKTLNKALELLRKSPNADYEAIAEAQKVLETEAQKTFHRSNGHVILSLEDAERALFGLNDWTLTYASDMCDENDVEKAYERIIQGWWHAWIYL